MSDRDEHMSDRDGHPSFAPELDDPLRVDLLQKIQAKLSREMALADSLALWFADIEKLERLADLDDIDLEVQLGGEYGLDRKSRSGTEVLVSYCKKNLSLTIWPPGPQTAICLHDMTP